MLVEDVADTHPTVEVGRTYILHHRHGHCLLRPMRVVEIDPSVVHLDGGAVRFETFQKNGKWSRHTMLLSTVEFRERIARKATEDDLTPESGSTATEE